ncbi:MAG TPA: hypothetical protein VE466_01980 [Acidimicrobiales bacterium]|jgi:hypothetical protein|nr:hypothetical protein [Acidimicrobiales bacterium]
MRGMPTAGLEQARWPRVAGALHPVLRPLLERDYAGFPGQPIRPTGPAGDRVSTADPEIRDSAYRPPQFVTRVHGSHLALDGACSPSYLEVWLAPLGTHALLGVADEDHMGRNRRPERCARSHRKSTRRQGARDTELEPAVRARGRVPPPTPRRRTPTAMLEIVDADELL